MTTVFVGTLSHAIHECARAPRARFRADSSDDRLRRHARALLERYDAATKNETLYLWDNLDGSCDGLDSISPDSASESLYFQCFDTGSVGRISTQPQLEDLHLGLLQAPHGEAVCVDPVNRALYYGSHDSSGPIYRYDIDADTHAEWLSGHRFAGCYVDAKAKYVYWTTFTDGELYRAELAGGGASGPGTVKLLASVPDAELRAVVRRVRPPP